MTKLTNRTVNFKLPKLGCYRCGHEWYPRSLYKPVACPKCNSKVWDQRKKDVDVLEEVRHD